MPTVLRKDGFSIVINTNDHEPPHVHVRKGGENVIINIEDGTARAVYMNPRNLRQAQDIVAENRDFLIGRWNEIEPIP